MRGLVPDGGYTDNLPILDGQTVTVSPFSGGCHICPTDDLDPNVIQVKTLKTVVELLKLTLCLSPDEHSQHPSGAVQGEPDEAEEHTDAT